MTSIICYFILSLPTTLLRFLSFLHELMAVPGAKLLFGGELLPPPHSIPACYGSWTPTAVQVPLEALQDHAHFRLCTTEVFGPFQLIVEYSNDDQLDLLLQLLEKTEAHLTAAIVSRSIDFQQKVLAATINGTTYCGIRARTTGAPQNHW